MQSNGSPSFAESEGPTSELPLDPPNPASPISSLSFSHNHVISGNETGVFSAYDIQTGTPICSYNFHQGPITSISSTVNNIVVTGGLDGRLQVYNFYTNQLNASFNENKNAIIGEHDSEESFDFDHLFIVVHQFLHGLYGPCLWPLLSFKQTIFLQ